MLMSASLIVNTLIMLFLTMVNVKAKKNNIMMMFECGFNSMSQKKMNFSTNFLLMCMMFLVFDVEMTFLIPVIMSSKTPLNFCIYIASMFLLVLVVVLIKEWTQGTLEWNK